MDPVEKRELKRRAWAKLAAQKRRAGLLRGRVVVASLICFVLLWGIVFAQMATGNDPVLAKKSTTAARRTAQGAQEELETTETGEVDPRRDRRGEEATAADGAEAEALEAETAEDEDEAAELAELEAAEAQPLVTSQS